MVRELLPARPSVNGFPDAVPLAAFGKRSYESRRFREEPRFRK